MIAAAAFGDVVEQPGEIEDLDAIELRNQPAAQRILVRHFGYGEAAQVAHDHEDVFIHRVDMKQIVLHAPDDASEGRDVAAEHAVLVHAPQRVGDAGGTAQDFHEKRAILAAAPECRIDMIAGVPQRPHRRHGKALEFRMVLKQQEGFQDRRRLALEQAVAGFEEFRIDAETFVQVAGFRRRQGKNPPPQIVQHDGIEQLNGFCGCVELLHQLFAGAPGRRVGQAVFLGERGLEIEQQAVFAPVGQVMQARSQHGKRGFVPLELARFLAGQYFLASEILPAVSETGGAADPEYVLQVAQPARAFLDIRFEVVGSIVEACVPLLLLEQLGFDEIWNIEVFDDGIGEAPVLLAVAGNQSGFEQCGLNGYIASCLILAFTDRAHAVTDFESDVPEHTDQSE